MGPQKYAWLARTGLPIVPATQPGEAREGRAIRLNTGGGAPNNAVGAWAQTSQDATDVLNPVGRGAVLIKTGAADTDAITAIAVRPQGVTIRAIAGTGGVAIGEAVRPEWSATPANIDRFVGFDTTPTTETDPVWRWGFAETAAAAGQEFDLILDPEQIAGAT